ncbi:MAG: serine/threonine protein kinase [Planctomycetes bacterium]|nr:serine/threonine protein kinase [Planctomycetota bacterium]
MVTRTAVCGARCAGSASLMPAHPSKGKGDLAPGTIIGDRYRIESLLGKGGMGAVYLAFDPKLQRRVALKILGERHRDAPDAVERFIREARGLARCSHPNLVQVYEVFPDPREPWFVMEYHRARTLSQRVRKSGAFPPETAARILRHVCAALGEIHKHGLIHRDIKTANILLTEDRRVILMDFGLVKAPDELSLTLEGMILGTPEYMSPEQAQGKPLTPASDLYSLGIVLYELLTGKVPFTGSTALTVLRKQIQDPPPEIPADRKDIPVPLRAAVRRAMAKDPAERFQTTRAFAEALGAEALGGSASGATAAASAVSAPPTRGSTAPGRPLASLHAAPPPAPSAPARPVPSAPIPARSSRARRVLLATVLFLLGAAGLVAITRDDTLPRGLPPAALPRAQIERLLLKSPLPEAARRLRGACAAPADRPWLEGLYRRLSGPLPLRRTPEPLLLATREAHAALVARLLSDSPGSPWEEKARGHIGALRERLDRDGAAWPPEKLKTLREAAEALR